MVRNFIKVALRNLWKNKSYTSINIFGITLGLTCSLFIFHYIRYEQSFDQYHSKSDRIYRMVGNFMQDGNGERPASMPFWVRKQLQIDNPETIEHIAQFFNFQKNSLLIQYGDIKFNEEHLFVSTGNVFEVFDFELTQGNPKTALMEPNTIVLSESISQKYFGDENPMGKILKFENKADLIVTGIMKDVPVNSHFHPEILVSFGTLESFLPEHFLHGRSRWNPVWSYILVKEGVSQEQLDERLEAFMNQHHDEHTRSYASYSAQPITDIHLHSKLDFEIQSNSDATYLQILSAIALFILVIATLNFVNLSSAHSLSRAKEVGIRKVMGSSKSQLKYQFIGESVIQCMLSALLCVAIVSVALPYFNYLSGSGFALNVILSVTNLSLLFLTSIILGVLGGWYPAFRLSSFESVMILKGKYSSGQQSKMFRNALVVVQFGISFILIIGAMVSRSQLQYMLNQDMGFDKENIILLPLNSSASLPMYDILKTKLLADPNVLSITATEDAPGISYNTREYDPAGVEPTNIPTLHIHEDFVSTFGLELIAGRDITSEYRADTIPSVVVNESFVKFAGWNSPEEAINQTVQKSRNRKIVGVVKDFHYASLHQAITPFVLRFSYTRKYSKAIPWDLVTRYAAVKINGDEVQSTVRRIESIWNETVPSQPFEILYFNQELGKVYRFDFQINTLVSLFSVVAIAIAALGLFGLISYATEQKFREIGIRKVVGSSVFDIVRWLMINTLKPIILAIAIASVGGWFLLNQWLAGFAYRIDISWFYFLLSAGLLLIIAVLTSWTQVVRAAKSNPVDVIRER